MSDDFDLNRGKVIDTLRRDYPDIFVTPLDYSIYIKDIEVTDPNGVEFHGLSTYMNLFSVVRFCAKNIFDAHEITFKTTWDPIEQAVRVLWHVKI